MFSTLNPPLTPGFGSNTGANTLTATAQTKNPFFTIGNQFLPRNLHDVIRWVRFITIHSPVTTEVLRKLSTYPITDFVYANQSPAELVKYKEITKSFRLKSTLNDIGFQYFSMGNVFVSIYYPFTRMYVCPNCKTSYNAEHSHFLSFRNFHMEGDCPKCGQKGIFTRMDSKLKDINSMNLIVWDPVNITVHRNPISGRTRYFYSIPNDIRKRVLAGDRLTIDSLQWEFIECIRDKKDFEFDDDKIFHLKNIDTTMSINGISIPPLVSHFNLVFYQTTLRRANESIASDFMAPMRIIFPQPQTSNSDPVVAMSMRNFVTRIEEAMTRHKRDNNHVLVAPVPVGYQAVSGEGKALLVNQEIAQAEESLLLSLGVSRELLSGQTNWTSSTVGLRLMKNTLDSYVGQIEELLNWIFTKSTSYLGISNTDVSLVPFQLTDDDALKSILVGLSGTGNVSMSTVYEAMGRNWEEELGKMEEDARRKARHEVRVKFESEQAAYLEGLSINQEAQGDTSYRDALAGCQEIANRLITASPEVTRQVLSELKVSNYAHYLMVSKLIEEGRTQMSHAQNAEEHQANMAASTSGKPKKPGVGSGSGPSSPPPEEEEDPADSQPAGAINPEAIK